MGSGASAARGGETSSSPRGSLSQNFAAPPGAAAHLIKYQNGRPRVQADEVIGCFTTVNEFGEVLRGPGLLYRLLVYKKKQWMFYNDTREYTMAITAFFGPDSVIKAVGKSKLWREMPSGLLVMELMVPPLATEPFLEGEPNDGYDIRFRAVPY